MANSGKQQLLAFLLIMVVLFLTPKYMEYIAPEQVEAIPETVLESEAINNYVDSEIRQKDLINPKICIVNFYTFVMNANCNSISFYIAYLL